MENLTVVIIFGFFDTTSKAIFCNWHKPEALQEFYLFSIRRLA